MSFSRGVRSQIYTQMFIFIIITTGLFITRCAAYQCGCEAVAYENKFGTFCGLCAAKPNDTDETEDGCMFSCNDECYRPKLWDCVENKLCPPRQILCHINPHESYCYDPSSNHWTCTCPSDYTSDGDKFCKFQSRHELKCNNAGGFYCGEVCYEYNITSQIDVVCSGGRRAECRNGWIYCKNECHSPESGAKCYRGHTLCRKDEEYCEPHVCFDRNLSGKCYGLSMCRKNESICKYDCYDPSVAICYNGRTVCQKNESICGYDKCYDPRVATCYNDRTVCQTNEFLCGNECYNPRVNNCYNNDTLCQKNQSICGNSCYDQEGEICYDDVPCHKGEAKCGTTCYNPNIKNCFDDRIACRHGMQSCGDFCMWPHNETCHDMYDNIRVRPKACPNSDKLCADKCYNPDYSTCWNSYLCPVGLKNTLGHKCVKGVVCKIHEEACNGLCYDPLKVGKHATCIKRYDTTFFNVWYVDNKRYREGQVGASVSESEEFKCDTGFEENMNGDCQRVFKWKEATAQSSLETVDAGEDYE